MLHPPLAKFQGPSLLAYNDAVFTDEDWTNIQKLKRSDKRSDPFKVGKFGIGFNSVFHVTGRYACVIFHVVGNNKTFEEENLCEKFSLTAFVLIKKTTKVII